MRYRLGTMLIVLTVTIVGFGGGIAAEKWRVARERAADELIPHGVIRVVRKNGVIVEQRHELVYPKGRR